MNASGNDTSGSPHLRGDGPLQGTRPATEPGFSSPAWGWSGFASYRAGGRAVLPTRVGMVRSRWKFNSFALSSPHPRGDGPSDFIAEIVNPRFSPPAWGWSDLDDDECTCGFVLPTRVGMVRFRR